MEIEFMVTVFRKEGTEATYRTNHPTYIKNRNTYSDRSMNKGEDQIVDIDLNLIDKIILMHEDVAAALASLPDFGFISKKNLADIQQAQNMLNDLRMMLGNYIYTQNKYRETLGSLKNFLQQSGVSECVDDLITVRKNSRMTLE